MPLYLCRTRSDALNAQARERIAADITRIHCEVTGAPPIFVHAFFLPMDEPCVHLHGSIRAGRTDEQKAQIQQRMRASIAEHGDLESTVVRTTITDTPASWVMEGGEIYPEPGEEAAWLVDHEARMQARQSA